MAEISDQLHHVLHPSGKHGKAVLIGGGVLGLILVYYLWKSRSSAAANTAATTPDLSGTGATGNTGYLPSSGAGSPGTTSTDNGSTTPLDTSGTDTSATGPDLTTNTGWEQAAVAFLTGHGTAGVNAQSAIEKYLNGDTLNYQDYGLVNQAISQLGIAPQGVFGIPSFTGPPKPPSVSTPKPPAHKPPAKHVYHKPPAAHHPAAKPAKATHHYVVKSGDTLTSIAHKHHTTVKAIINHNKKAIGNHPNLIHTGLHLVIP